MKTIDEDIKSGQFKKIYLLYGDEAYLKNQYKDKLKKALVQPDDTMNFTKYEGKGIEVREMIDLCETMPFFADHRVVLVENSGFFKNKCDELQKDFLRLIERDAEVFEPLSKAYGMPRETEEEKAEKARVMEIVLKDACSVPMEIMEKCCEAIEVIVEFAAKGSTLAISDAGVGAAFCKAALKGASLNVYINTKSMKDREYAEELNKKADAMLEKYTKIADETFDSVLFRLK